MSFEQVKHQLQITIQSALTIAKTNIISALRKPTIQAAIAITLLIVTFVQWWLLRRSMERQSITSTNDNNINSSENTQKRISSRHRHDNTTAAAAATTATSSSSDRKARTQSSDSSGADLEKDRERERKERRKRSSNNNNNNNTHSSSSRSRKSNNGEQHQEEEENEKHHHHQSPTTTSSKKKHQQQQQQQHSPPNAIFRSGHEKLGHVVTVRVKREDVTEEELSLAARAYAQSLRPACHVVLRDTAGVTGELRQPTHAPIWLDEEKALASAGELAERIRKRAKKLGALKTDEVSSVTSSTTTLTSTNMTSPTKSSATTQIYQLSTETLKQLQSSPCFTMHSEQSIRFSFDASRVMFSSGNTTERMHFGMDVDATNETVVDMFAGIGYFTVPLASSMTHPTRIIALEKNPESCAFLACNVLLNDCLDRVVIFNGDNRECGNLFVGKCDRVMMGYIPSCQEFLPRAVSFLKQKKISVSEKEKTPPRSPVVASSSSSSSTTTKAVSFAPGSTPPSSKNENTSSSSTTMASSTTKKTNNNNKEKFVPLKNISASEEKDSSNDNGSDHQQQQETSSTSASASASSSSSSTVTTTAVTSSRPIGVIHYHFLSDSNVKPHAAATATMHMLEALGPQIGSCCTISQLRVVKSYAPKKYHCVADFQFS